MRRMVAGYVLRWSHDTSTKFTATSVADDGANFSVLCDFSVGFSVEIFRRRRTNFSSHVANPLQILDIDAQSSLAVTTAHHASANQRNCYLNCHLG